MVELMELQFVRIFCVECVIVLFAMGVDLVSGIHKARMRGEVRSSYGLKRTVSKFILYYGSLLLSLGMDVIFIMCDFWGVVPLTSFLNEKPLFSSVVSLFLLTVEIKSIWEKAEKKRRKDASEAIDLMLKVMERYDISKSVANAVKDGIENFKDKREN
jgi:hypothetical protein